MSWTKRALIAEALSELSLQGYEFDTSPEEQMTALRRLDSMMAAWEEDGIRLGYATPEWPNASDPDDESGIPDTSAETVYLQLAIRLGPGYGKTLNATTRKIAVDGYARLLRRASIVPAMSRPSMPAGAGNRRYRPFLPPVAPSCVPPPEPYQPCCPAPTADCGVVEQQPRIGDFTLVSSDSNTVIPVLGACIVTLDASSNLTGPLRIVRHDAGTLTIQQVGVSLVNPATGAPWATLQVVNYLSSVLIEPGGMPDEYVGLRIGA